LHRKVFKSNLIYNIYPEEESNAINRWRNGMNHLSLNPAEMNKIEPVEQIPLLDQENGA
jgi:hypothetical protein